MLRGGEDGSSSDVRPASSTRRCADPGRSRARLWFGRAREGTIAVVALRCSSASCDGCTLLTAAMVTAAVARRTPAEALSAATVPGAAGASAAITEAASVRESVEWSRRSIDFLPPGSILPFHDLHLMA